MEIKHDNNKFYVGEDSEHTLAEVRYVPTGSTKLIADHTHVDDSLRGEGVGQKLVEQLVAYARENDLKIVPTCPFIKSQFEKTPEYKDVWNN
ncbi:GNAT family N-acetyltransferase [Chryseomicrobium palamuruense]|uniref:GNAT family N-acetyltransferase n=1 Tax=Chryseomicrobium palamuruense TaxID=682973 RepID=A0ABV8US05_9BACL